MIIGINESKILKNMHHSSVNVNSIVENVTQMLVQV